jgi:hypothetical protein
MSTTYAIVMLIDFVWKMRSLPTRGDFSESPYSGTTHHESRGFPPLRDFTSTVAPTMQP